MANLQAAVYFLRLSAIARSLKNAKRKRDSAQPQK